MSKVMIQITVVCVGGSTLVYIWQLSTFPLHPPPKPPPPHTSHEHIHTHTHTSYHGSGLVCQDSQSECMHVLLSMSLCVFAVWSVCVWRSMGLGLGRPGKPDHAAWKMGSGVREEVSSVWIMSEHSTVQGNSMWCCLITTPGWLTQSQTPRLSLQSVSQSVSGLYSLWSVRRKGKATLS